MRTFALLLVSVGTVHLLEAAPSALAADVAVTRTKPVPVRVIHHRSRVVRDYDGTPIILRARPMVLRDVRRHPLGSNLRCNPGTAGGAEVLLQRTAGAAGVPNPPPVKYPVPSRFLATLPLSMRPADSARDKAGNLTFQGTLGHRARLFGRPETTPMRPRKISRLLLSVCAYFAFIAVVVCRWRSSAHTRCSVRRRPRASRWTNQQNPKLRFERRCLRWWR